MILQSKEVPPKGWPRPFLHYRRSISAATELMPWPWINAKDTLLAFRPSGEDRTIVEEAYAGRLCAVCGEHIAAPYMVFGHYFSAADEDVTNGPGCHPRCLLLAMKFCPHFKRELAKDADSVIAFWYRGTGLGFTRNPHDDMSSDIRYVSTTCKSVTLPQLKEIVQSAAS